MRPLPLAVREREGASFSTAELSPEFAAALSQRYGGKLEVSRQGEAFRVKPGAWAGVLPCGAHGTLHITPKVSLLNLFRMLEWAWDLKNFELFADDPLVDLARLEDVYERLAKILALRTLARVRSGLVRAYEPHQDHLPYLRGRLDAHLHLRAPDLPTFPCRFEELTADVEDNRILAWTLRQIARSGITREDRSLPDVRAAFRAVAARVTLTQVSAATCIGRRYHRLNQDYEPLHALCRFFLEHTGPENSAGDHGMLPFLVQTEKLFELFVPRWLQGHLPAGWRLETQVALPMPGGGDPALVDSVLWQGAKPRAVIDTKYKQPRLHKTDVYQVHTYAAILGAPAAFLIYPTAAAPALDAVIGQLAPVRVRALGFDLSGDLESAGTSMLDELLATIPQSSPGSSNNTAS